MRGIHVLSTNTDMLNELFAQIEHFYESETHRRFSADPIVTSASNTALSLFIVFRVVLLDFDEWAND